MYKIILLVLLILGVLYLFANVNNLINIDIKGNISIKYFSSNNEIKNFRILDENNLEIINNTSNACAFDFYKMIYNDSFVFYDKNGNNITHKYSFLNNKKYIKEIDSIFNKYKSKFNKKYFIFVSIKYQKMFVFDSKGNYKKIYNISSSKYGVGNTINSYKTPLGLHIIKDKVGDNMELGTYFKYKKPVGKAKIYYDKTDSDEDLITTRIMHLEGMEPGINDNSYIRHIYIHGTQEEGLIGTPASHGCIRMKNNDIIELYDLIKINTPVYIIL